MELSDYARCACGEKVQSQRTFQSSNSAMDDAQLLSHSPGELHTDW